MIFAAFLSVGYLWHTESDVFFFFFHNCGIKQLVVSQLSGRLCLSQKMNGVLIARVHMSITSEKKKKRERETNETRKKKCYFPLPCPFRPFFYNRRRIRRERKPICGSCTPLVGVERNKEKLQRDATLHVFSSNPPPLIVLMFRSLYEKYVRSEGSNSFPTRNPMSQGCFHPCCLFLEGFKVIRFLNFPRFPFFYIFIFSRSSLVNFLVVWLCYRPHGGRLLSI